MYRTLSYTGVNFDNTFLHHMVTHIRRFQCDFKILNLDMENDQEKSSSVTIRITASDPRYLNDCTGALLELGMAENHDENATFCLASKDGFAPDDFYLLEGNPISVYYQHDWHTIQSTPPSTVVVLRNGEMQALFLDQIKKNDLVLCGKQGVKVEQYHRPQRENFEKPIWAPRTPKTLNALESQAYMIWHTLKENKQCRAKTILMLGHSPFLECHTAILSELIQQDFFQGCLLDHQLAVEDLTQAFSMNNPSDTINLNHQYLKSINRVQGYGSIHQSYQAGALQKGLLYQLLTQNIPFIIPSHAYTHTILPDALTHPHAIRESLLTLFQNVKTVLILGFDDNSIAYTSLLPEQTDVILVDKNKESDYSCINLNKYNITTYNANTSHMMEALLQLLRNNHN